MIRYRSWISLREVDAAAGTRKGAAFRRFKRCEAALAEGRDYIVLHTDRDREAISELRSQNRVYESSVNVLLISTELAEHITAALRREASMTR